jgi:hypothetical protein
MTRPSPRVAGVVASAAVVAVLLATSVGGAAAFHDIGTASHVAARADSSSPSTYAVRFVAIGLGGAYDWWVKLGGDNESSSTSISLTFTGEANGTYSYQVAAKGMVAAPAFGSLTVRGANVDLNVTFSPESATSPAPSGGLSLTEVAALVAAIVLGVVAGVVFFVRRARRRRTAGEP